MRKLTVTIPDDVYRSARIRAAGRGTSVRALVVAYLRSLAGETDVARLLARQKDLQAKVVRLRAAERLTRDELHRRADC